MIIRLPVLARSNNRFDSALTGIRLLLGRKMGAFQKATTLLMLSYAFGMAQAAPKVNEAAAEFIVNNVAAPLTEAAMAKIKSDIFGSGRAARSTDVVVENPTNRRFRLYTDDTFCSYGGFSQSMFPDTIIEPDTSVVFGMESNGVMTGVTCTVKYLETNGGDGWFELWNDNPYIGNNRAGGSAGGGLVIDKVVGVNNNNMVRFMVSEDAETVTFSPDTVIE